MQTTTLDNTSATMRARVYPQSGPARSVAGTRRIERLARRLLRAGVGRDGSGHNRPEHRNPKQ
jgi:hypothetical protein